VSSDEVCVEVVYRPANITEGIHVRASLDWTPNEQIKLQYPHWDVQNITLKVYRTTSIRQGRGGSVSQAGEPAP
jgi:hypothetical protein